MSRKYRNSYVPAVDGAVTVHVRFVTPLPTYTAALELVVGADVDAKDIQSSMPPEPFVSVTVTLAPGDTDVALTLSVGGPVIVNDTGFDRPPPGAGERTRIAADPVVARSAAPIAACSCVLLTNVVGRVEPFHCTTDDATKPVPVTVSVKAAPPTVALRGDIDVMAGAGFDDASTVTVGLVAARM